MTNYARLGVQVFQPVCWCCRLSLLEVLIPVFGVGKGDGFSLEQLMHFVGKAFGNSNADVRAAATRVTTLVGSSPV